MGILSFLTGKKWAVVKHSNGFSIQDRKKGAGTLLVNLSGDMAKVRAKIICDALNAYDPEYKRTTPKQPANLMHGPVNWEIRPIDEGKQILANGQFLCLIENEHHNVDARADDIFKALKQSDEKNEENTDKLMLARSSATGEGITKAFNDGRIIHAFRSGGGLRVVRIEAMKDFKRTQGEKLYGYGEHPDIAEALQHADEDYLAGHRKYEKVYGKKYPHYMTGSSTPASDLDEVVLRGYSFDVFKQNDEIVFQLDAYVDVRPSDEIQKEADKTRKPIFWKDSRGVVFKTEWSNSFGGGASSGVAYTPPGCKGGFLYSEVYEGRGPDMMSAFKAAREKWKALPQISRMSKEEVENFPEKLLE